MRMMSLIQQRLGSTQSGTTTTFSHEDIKHSVLKSTCMHTHFQYSSRMKLNIWRVYACLFIYLMLWNWYFIGKKTQMANKHKVDVQISLEVNIYHRDVSMAKTKTSP